MTANNAFHTEIAAIGGNAVLAELADIVGRRVQWYYRMVAPERGHGSWTEHAELIGAIEAGDPEPARALARRHTERTRQAYHRPRYPPPARPRVSARQACLVVFRRYAHISLRVT